MLFNIFLTGLTETDSCLTKSSLLTEFCHNLLTESCCCTCNVWMANEEKLKGW